MGITGTHELAFAFSGGGARGAYQVGLLRCLARRYPELEVPILTGVSAGSLNAVYLANQTGRFPDKVEGLTRHWSRLSMDRVFRTDVPSLLGRTLLWAGQLAIWGGMPVVPTARGLVDTAPLGALLREILGSGKGDLPGIARNLARDALRAIAVTTTHYATGATVTWCQGRTIREWERPQRHSCTTDLRIEHVLASAALPIFFPAVRIGREWYGDGAIRLHAPLAPAIHLGADRILAISTRYATPAALPAALYTRPYPEPAQIVGTLLNAVFLDLLDQDAMHLGRINRLLSGARPGPERALRRIELTVLRPSRDLSEIAGEYEAGLPRMFRWLLRRLGSRAAEGNDLLSVLLFQGDYAQRLIELGESDAEARVAELAALVEPCLTGKATRAEDSPSSSAGQG